MFLTLTRLYDRNETLSHPIAPASSCVSTQIIQYASGDKTMLILFLLLCKIAAFLIELIFLVVVNLEVWCLPKVSVLCMVGCLSKAHTFSTRGYPCLQRGLECGNERIRGGTVPSLCD